MLAIRTTRCSAIILGILTVLLSGCAPRQAAPTPGAVEPISRWSFDQTDPGRVPAGWSLDETNPTASPASWSVQADASAPSPPNVFALTASENYNGTYNLAIARSTLFGDLDLAVKVKSVAGVEDQGGGPVWRCQDADNYYICRVNPLEGNFRVYVVKDGRRRQLHSARVELLAERWYELRVVMVGRKITCFLDGESMLEAVDGTFREPGRVGLWTKADAVTSFDDLTVRSRDK
jgi:hypothetical protein